MTTKKTIISVRGLDIKSDSIYKVVGKPDNTAPSGFVELGVSKLPSEGIGDSVGCRFVQRGQDPQEGLFDTGFYLESPCYSSVSDTAAKEMVKSLNKHVVEPFEKIYGKGKLNHNNHEFWKDYRVFLTDGKIFSTSSVEDLLGLYIAMNSFQLTPKTDIGNPAFNDSNYCVEDKDRVRTINQERADNAITAISKFGDLVKTNKDLLVQVLQYIKVNGITNKTDVSVMNGAFYEWLNRNNENAQVFIKAVDLAQNKDTEDVIPLYIKLQKAIRQREVSTEGGYLMYKGKRLGADLKTAAFNLNSKKDLEDAKLAIIEIE